MVPIERACGAVNVTPNANPSPGGNKLGLETNRTLTDLPLLARARLKSDGANAPDGELTITAEVTRVKRRGDGAFKEKWNQSSLIINSLEAGLALVTAIVIVALIPPGNSRGKTSAKG
jgi:hypothetical protein